jgi:tetratricopeptide (TPR) repeat protein
MKTKLQIARVFYHIKKNAEVLKITEYVKNFASKYHIDELTEECLMLEAGVAIRLKDYQKANELMEYMPDPESIPTVIFKFKIALFENDYSKLEEYYLKVLSFDSVKNNRKIWLYINVQAMNRLPKYYNKEVYLKYVLELTKMSSQNNDQDILEISYTYLIRYYQEERMYKKAMEAANELLFYKDVPFEDKVVNRIYEN